MCDDSTGPERERISSAKTEHVRIDRSLTLRLERFAWDAIDEEATREGIAVEELIAFSVLYYLADVDSERIARRVSRSPYPRPLLTDPG
jgi:predicted DNA-binding ribbon-helix-helix protein